MMQPPAMDTQAGSPSFWWRIAATVCMIVFVLYASTVPISGNDFWLQAKVGQIIVTEHYIPDTLLFPFTEASSKSFHAHEWLVSIFFHYLLRYLGEEAIPFFIGALGLTLFALMARLAYVRGAKNYSVALLGGFVTILVENYRHELRPELPSLILMAILWLVIEAYKSNPRTIQILWASLVMILWANSHGSFVLGPILSGLYAAGTYLDEVFQSRFKLLRPSGKVWQLLVLLVVISASCLITPFGWDLVRFVFSFGNSAEAGIHLTEWIPTLDTRLRGLRGFWLALAIWSLTAGILLAHRKQFCALDVLLFAAFTFLALRAIRFPVYLGMVFAYIAPAYIAKYFDGPRLSLVGLRTLCILASASLLLIAIFGNVAMRHPYYYDDPTKFTAKMVQTVNDPSIHGNVLNSMELGAELVYRAYPRLRPAIDSRFDSYGPEYHRYILSLFKNDLLFDQFVQRHDVRYVLIDGTRYDDFTGLKSWQRGEWRIRSIDHRAVLFQRSDIHQ